MVGSRMLQMASRSPGSAGRMLTALSSTGTSTSPGAGACSHPPDAVILACHRIGSHGTQPRNLRGDRRRTRGPGGSAVPVPVSPLSRPDRVYRDAELPAEDVLRSHALLRVPVDLFSAPPDLASVYRPGNRHAGTGPTLLPDSRARVFRCNRRPAKPLRT